MKIRIPTTVEVDPVAWAETYGVDPKDVRQDVKDYFNGWCQEQIERLGLQKQSKPKPK